MIGYSTANHGVRAETEPEERLWQRYWASGGSDELHTQVVKHYLPLVSKTVERVSIQVRRRAEKDELLSIGVVGLHDAIRRFSKNGKAAFATFAQKRIRGAVMDELRRQDHLTRPQRRCYRRICSTIRQLSEKLSRMPSVTEIAEATGLSEDGVGEYMNLGQEAVSFDEEFREGVRYRDVLRDDAAPAPDEAADRAIAKDLLRSAIRTLSKREQQLLYLRHYESMRVKEIAEILEVSEGRVSQMYNEIVRKLRDSMVVQPRRVA